MYTSTRLINRYLQKHSGMSNVVDCTVRALLFTCTVCKPATHEHKITEAACFTARVKSETNNVVSLRRLKAHYVPLIVLNRNRQIAFSFFISGFAQDNPARWNDGSRGRTDQLSTLLQAEAISLLMT